MVIPRDDLQMEHAIKGVHNFWMKLKHELEDYVEVSKFQEVDLKEKPHKTPQTSDNEAQRGC